VVFDDGVVLLEVMCVSGFEGIVSKWWVLIY